MCLRTSPREWIEDYGCHDPALEGLNIYDVMEDFDNRIWNYLYGLYNRDQSPDARRKSRSL